MNIEVCFNPKCAGSVYLQAVIYSVASKSPPMINGCFVFSGYDKQYRQYYNSVFLIQHYGAANRCQPAVVSELTICSSLVFGHHHLYPLKPNRNTIKIVCYGETYNGDTLSGNTNSNK